MNWISIQEAYLSGKSTSQLAAEFGISQAWVSRGLRKLGTVMRPAKPYVRHTVDPTVFDSLSDEAQYWLGFMLTDGFVVYPKGKKRLPKIGLELQAQDKDHLQRFSDFLKSTYPLYYNKTANAWKVQVASQELADALAKHNIVPRKTRTAIAAQSLLTSRHFWRGVLDGDGSLQYRRTNIEYELAGVSLLFLAQFIDYVRMKTGNNPSITKNGHGCPRVKSTSNRLLLHLYQPGDLALPRKAAIVDRLRQRANIEEEETTCQQ